LFVVINVAVFFVAVVISYEGCHPNQSLYNTLRNRYAEAQKSFSKESKEAKAAAARRAQAEKRYNAAFHARQKTFERIVQEAEQCKESNDWFIEVYRRANLEVRRNPDVPASFKLQPREAIIPESLKSLDWDCDEKTPGGQS